MSENAIEAVLDYISRTAITLDEEGINHADYWIARMGLTDEEVFPCISREIHILGRTSISRKPVVLMGAAFLNGFFAGYVYANREELLAE